MSDSRAQSPGLLRRLAAILYDTFLVLPLIMVSVAAAIALQTAVMPSATEQTLPVWAIRLIAIACCVVFFSAFWLKGGQTLGMQAWRIRLVPVDDDRLSLRHAVIRVAGAALSFGCLGLGYFWCLVDRQGRSWHDRISRTELRLVPKRSADRSGTTEKDHTDNHA